MAQMTITIKMTGISALSQSIGQLNKAIGKIVSALKHADKEMQNAARAADRLASALERIKAPTLPTNGRTMGITGNRGGGGRSSSGMIVPPRQLPIPYAPISADGSNGIPGITGNGDLYLPGWTRSKKPPKPPKPPKDHTEDNAKSAAFSLIRGDFGSFFAKMTLNFGGGGKITAMLKTYGSLISVVGRIFQVIRLLTLALATLVAAVIAAAASIQDLWRLRLANGGNIGRTMSMANMGAMVGLSPDDMAGLAMSHPNPDYAWMRIKQILNSPDEMSARRLTQITGFPSNIATMRNLPAWMVKLGMAGGPTGGVPAGVQSTSDFTAFGVSAGVLAMFDQFKRELSKFMLLLGGPIVIGALTLFTNTLRALNAVAEIFLNFLKALIPGLFKTAAEDLSKSAKELRRATQQFTDKTGAYGGGKRFSSAYARGWMYGSNPHVVDSMNMGAFNL